MNPNSRTLTRPFSFPGFDTEEKEKPRQLVQLDQLVKEASKPARPRQPSDINRPRKPSDSRDSPEKASPTDPPANKPASPSNPPQENLKIEPTSNSTSARTPPASKPPSRPPRPFPPPTSAQLTARVAKKRPPPVLVNKAGEQGGAKPTQSITVIDTRSNDQESADQAKPSSTAPSLNSPTPSSPPVPPSPSRSTPPTAPPTDTTELSKQENQPLASSKDKPLNLPLDEQPKTTESSPMKTSSSASAVPHIVEADCDTEKMTKEAQEIATEEKDTLSPMTEQSSPQSKGRRLLNSMKKSLRLGGGRQRHSSAPGRSKTITSSPKAMHRSFTTRDSSSSTRVTKVYDQTVYPGKVLCIG